MAGSGTRSRTTSCVLVCKVLQAITLCEANISLQDFDILLSAPSLRVFGQTYSRVVAKHWADYGS